MRRTDVNLRTVVLSFILGAFAPVSVYADPNLTAIDLAPADAVIYVGQTQHYTATGMFDDGSVRLLDQGNTWATLPAAASEHYEGGAAVIDGVLYVAGGEQTVSPRPGVISFRPGDTLEAYDTVANTWTILAPMLTKRSCHGVAAVNGILYVVGGQQYINNAWTDMVSVEAFDPDTGGWTTRSSMPADMAGCVGVGIVDGILYAVKKGYVDEQPFMVAYDPAADTWTTKAAVPIPQDISNLNSFAVAGGSSRLYVLGGNGAENYTYTLQNTLYAYDPHTNSWSIRAPMPTPRSDLGAAVLGDLLYAVGGYNAGGQYDVVEVYDPRTNSWQSQVSLPEISYDALVAADQASGLLYTFNLASALWSFTPSEIFWSSSQLGIATIAYDTNAGGALATASLRPGTTTVTATAGSISGSTTLTTLALPIHKLFIGISGYGDNAVVDGNGEPICEDRKCTKAYASGTTLELYPIDAQDYSFREWRGDCAGQGIPCILVMDGDHSIYAKFHYIPY